jgi:hypothetical protein
LQSKGWISLERTRKCLHPPRRDEIIAQIEDTDVIVQWDRRELGCNGESAFVAKHFLAQLDLGATRRYTFNSDTHFRIAASEPSEQEWK